MGDGRTLGPDTQTVSLTHSGRRDVDTDGVDRQECDRSGSLRRKWVAIVWTRSTGPHRTCPERRGPGVTQDDCGEEGCRVHSFKLRKVLLWSGGYG